jgi:hypothetical protein
MVFLLNSFNQALPLIKKPETVQAFFMQTIEQRMDFSSAYQ